MLHILHSALLPRPIAETLLLNNLWGSEDWESGATPCMSQTPHLIITHWVYLHGRLVCKYLIANNTSNYKMKVAGLSYCIVGKPISSPAGPPGWFTTAAKTWRTTTPQGEEGSLLTTPWMQIGALIQMQQSAGGSPSQSQLILTRSSSEAEPGQPSSSTCVYTFVWSSYSIFPSIR